MSRSIPTAERSINSVIPQRTVSRKVEEGKLQDYKLEKQLGSGSFGVVFRALQVPLDRTVAIKILTSGASADAQQRDKLQNEFLREAQFTGRLEHPNIVPIHDIGLTLDRQGNLERPFYVMKEIHGTSWLQKIARLSRAENLEIFKKVVDAIGFAHDKHVLHCDLKPENVMLGQFGEVLVVDWGQAIDLNQPGSIRPGGTPAYISPEMATFWCDLYLEKKPVSPAITRVGPHSDVYLLGGLLFEIITGKLPRRAENGESQYDVIQRARNNDIIAHDEYLDDELMQIARRALRLTESNPIENVKQLQQAIRQYEDRALSFQLRERADQLLEQAKSNRDYDDYQKARFGYEEALKKWDDNLAAQTGLVNARLGCARLALADQNFDLGIKLLAEPDSDTEVSLKQQLLSGKTKRDRRKKLVRHLALGLAASIIVGIGLNAVMINLNLRTRELANQATIEKNKIEQEIGQLQIEMADFQEQIDQFPATLQREQEKFNQDLADQKRTYQTQLETERAALTSQLAAEQQQFDENLKIESEKFAKKLADQTAQFEQKRSELSNQLASETAKFEREKQQFDSQRSKLNLEIGSLTTEVATLDESSKLLRFKSTITNILQALQAGNFREARELLDDADGKHRWEWGRLNLLAHREVESDYPPQDLMSVCASSAGTRLGLVFPEHIEIRNLEDLGLPQIILPIGMASAAALSADGQLLAIGLPAGSRQRTGIIELVDLTDPTNPRPFKTLGAQSASIDHLEFSPQGRLLSVGTPSRLRKSSGGLEEELMIWSDDWQRLDVDLTDERGVLPRFTWATFARDGHKILTTYPEGLGREQSVHLFSEAEDGFRWLARSPIANLNCASFLDDAGTVIIANFRDSGTGTYSLVRWDCRPNGTIQSSVSALDSIVTMAPVEQKILTLKRFGNWLLTGGEDRKITLWNWPTQSSTSFPGHSRDVDFCTMLPADSGDHVLISISTGAAAEIVKTDLSTYRPEVESQAIAQSAADDQPSPTTLFVSGPSATSAYGNDQGQASVWFPETADQSGERNIQWETSAWKHHYLSDNFLFAQSRGDYFYQYDRQTGGLLKVLTFLAKSESDENQRSEITSFQPSADGALAVVTSDNQRPEFEIWNLETQTRLHTIDYGAEKIFGTETDKQLALLKVSPDGRWVVGGKVGLFAWSTQTGQRIPLRLNPGESPRSTINSIHFLRGTTKVIASWKQRIDLVDLESGISQYFAVPRLSAGKNESSIVDCRRTDDQILILLRTDADEDSKAGIGLLELNSNRFIADFPDATVASFSRTNPDRCCYVTENNSQSQVLQYDLPTGRTEVLKFQWDGELQNRFRKIIGVDQHANGNITLQSVTPNRVNLTRPNWNSLTFNQDLKPGNLRVFAKPEIEYVAVAGNTAITLDSQILRFWTFDHSGVRPNGLFPEPCQVCRLSPDQSLLAIAPEGAADLLLVAPATQTQLAQLTNQGAAGVSGIAWSADSQYLAIGRTDGSVDLWSRAGQQQFDQVPGLPADTEPATELSLSDDGSVIMSVLQQAGAARVSRRVGNRWQSLRLRYEDGQPIVTGDLSGNGDRAATGSDDGRLTIWNTEWLNENLINTPLAAVKTSDREVMDLQKQHQSRIRFVQFIPGPDQSALLVSAEQNDGNNSYLIWNTRPPAK